MARAEIFDRCRVEILLDHRRTDVRAARNCRRVPELLSDRAHDGGNRTLRIAFRLGRTAFGKCDGRDQRAAPGTEVFRRELVPEISPHVAVQLRARESTQAFVPLVAEETAAARKCE